MEPTTIRVFQMNNIKQLIKKKVLVVKKIISSFAKFKSSSSIKQTGIDVLITHRCPQAGVPACWIPRLLL